MLPHPLVTFLLKGILIRILAGLLARKARKDAAITFSYRSGRPAESKSIYNIENMNIGG